MSLCVVKTEKGTLIGEKKEGYTLFAGIPYAKAPIGARRFQPPQAMEEPFGELVCSQFRAICPQGTPVPGSFYEKEFYREDWKQVFCKEDCLYLNIWTPACQEDEKLPVLFWIHGGALNHGYGHEIEFDGAEYCKQGVILVTINYRVGIWGFLSHPQVNGGIANMGIRDQICALNWVYENIGAFGGDPHAITVAGQSAGGFSVQALLTSKLTEGKIAAAIMQSGGGINPEFHWCISKEQAWKNAEEFCLKQGIEHMEALNTMSQEELQELAEEFPCALAVDGTVLQQDCNEAMEQGKYPAIPYLVGSNRNDLDVTEEMLQQGIPSAFYMGAKTFADHAAEKGLPVYVYLFAHSLPGDKAGSFHSAELWYMFGTLSRCWRPMKEEDRVLSEQMVACWSSFVKEGRPKASGLEWKQYKAEDMFIMEF